MLTYIKRTIKSPIISLIITFCAAYYIMAAFFVIGLQHNIFQGDVFGYWQDSINWRTPYHSFHVPGYPLLIALLRSITFNVLSPILTMWIINLLAFVISIYLVYKIIENLIADKKTAFISAFLFGLWPFVGLTYTVIPLADLPVICLFLVGLYDLQRSKYLPAGVFFGFALVTHKAIWIFVFLIVAFDFIRRKEYFSTQNFILLVATMLPLTILWLFGSSYHHSYLWLISSNLNIEVASRGNLPILDGILGTFLDGGLKGVFKGMILIAFLTVTVGAVFANIKLPSIFRYWGIAIALGVLALFVVLNQMEIWAAVRFSRLLIIPLAIGLSRYINGWVSNKNHTALIALAMVILFISQFGYAWYIARVFYV